MTECDTSRGEGSCETLWPQEPAVFGSTDAALTFPGGALGRGGWRGKMGRVGHGIFRLFPVALARFLRQGQDFLQGLRRTRALKLE